MVIEHPESPVNKGNITCKLIDNGHIALTKQSFTETRYGKKSKKNPKKKKKKKNNRETIPSNT